ncbi:pseudoazurin [Rhodopseudomonas julia]|uniref:Pseudoazurin n=1 Tax=Rhodopseudomonas julia TaxID=200617 RepID=A0ABU0C8Z2_9BRAD|nr:pseudoazurin [Rhodopseudomonas julia]MDQ0326998.1 pseudoazurin [Rhodopseudomonas julia]
MREFLALAFVLASGIAHAETFEVQMLNRGEKGSMVYDPDFLRVAPGDTIRFVATTPGHNARTIAGMAPEGAEEIKTPLGETADVVAETPGIYGLKCSPHYAMGMVMMVAVGEEADPGAFELPEGLPSRARKRLEEIIAENSK